MQIIQQHTFYTFEGVEFEKIVRKSIYIYTYIRFRLRGGGSATTATALLVNLRGARRACVWASSPVVRSGGHCWDKRCGTEEESRTCVAQKPSEEKATCTGLHRRVSVVSTGAGIQAEVEKSDRCIGTPSYLQLPGVACINSDLQRYDLVLPDMQNQQRTAVHLLQTVPSALVRGVASFEAKVAVEESKKTAAKGRGKGGNRSEGDDGGVPRQGTLGSQHANVEGQLQDWSEYEWARQGRGGSSVHCKHQRR